MEDEDLGLAKFFTGRKDPTPRAAGKKPWVEKYRPKRIEDLVHQGEVKSALRKCVESGNLPHLLFYGPPGTGKTSAILAIAHELFGPLFRERVMELNASDERGIGVVREKVKTFAQLATASSESTRERGGGFPCPPYKLIVLDEADSMTDAAQAALRRLMEQYSRVTRFCLICNYVSRILDPVASRCAKFRFQAVSSAVLEARLAHIAGLEACRASPAALTALRSASGGDMRRAINLLQGVHEATPEGAEIAVEAVLDVAGVVPERLVTSFVAAARRSPKEAESAAKALVREGYAVGQFVLQLLDVIVGDERAGTREKAKALQVLGEVDKALVDGADEMLQVMYLALSLHQILYFSPSSSSSSSSSH